ncbi:hypothetical protein [Marinirhabdus gelatinilytica]|uniref:Uncharacterized protein n=1 Tax=Marinirhabdus gelatinilytica TaxID=1703343 RepID=A0A370QM20_9FLAO|nr:hypothetical protein [Marinirhabdus gelatinilytica]RDK89060.1 hypothetical protein C8D94_101939 [Marinirhabdus gelatinilytica]
MDKILSIALLALAGFKVVSSFMQNQEFGTLFGQEINIWVYRGIWLVVGILAVSSILKKIKSKS